MNPRQRPSRHPHRAATSAALILATLLPIPAQAQTTDRQDANARLSSALIRLNHNPRDADALTAAGNAALATGDTDAAVGFFTRALRLSPDNPQIEAGLAGAKVRAEDPLSAIPLFIAADNSVAAGKGSPISPELQGDRGLAYDLIGDNASAQYYYKQALASAPASDAGAEIARRLALSLAIGGDRRASETVLAALLQKQDRAAWRARIFALAILGFEEEAVSTARATMPPDLALQIAPYLRYMRRLTPAQQAAAANLGHFPQAAEIGHDDPRIAQFARTVARPHLASADQKLVPTGAPLGSTAAATPTAGQPPAKKHRRDRNQETAQAVRAAELANSGGASGSPPPAGLPPPELIASREAQPAGPSQLTAAPPPPTPSAQPRPARVVPSPPRPPAPAPAAPVAAPTASATGQPLWTLKPSPPHPAEPSPHPTEPPARPSFSDAFATMSPVMVDITPERGAVDLRKIKPARAIPPPPPPPSHPSRIWVELGVGRDPDRLAFDWHRMVKDDPEIFRGKKPFVTGWARTNRLLVGPFETDKAATAFTEKLHKADRPSAFVWTSPAGQVVDPLDAPQ
jgi:tetratricopeptide (TPR) repeat protein